MPQIVVLDGHTLNPGDNSWDSIERLGTLKVYDRTQPCDIVERSRDAEILLTNKTVLSGSVIDQLPALKYIGVLATGHNIVDLAAARRRRVPVCNVPEYGSRTVAQFTWALILELCHHVGQHAASVAKGDWTKCPDFCYWQTSQVELAGNTLGLVGYGRIARHVGDIGAAFGMRIVACGRPDRKPQSIDAVKWLTVDELFAQSDIVSLHCPLTNDNERMVNSRLLQKMKCSAYLINTSRGGLIDEGELASALQERRIAGAAIDVVSNEPVRADNPLLTAPNCLITPHIAWSTLAARQRIMSRTAENIAAFLNGQVVNDVTAVS